MKKYILQALGCIPIVFIQYVSAQPRYLDCLNIEIEIERLSCFDKEARAQKKKETEEAEKNQPKAIKFSLQVRDTSSSVADFRGFELGQKGGSISLEHDNTENATTAKIAIFGKFPAQLNGRVGPFIGISWLRHGTGDKRSDIRDFTFGSVGPLWESSGLGYEIFSLLTTVQFTHRSDLFGTSKGNLLRGHFDLVWVPLASGRLLGGFSMVPHIGFLSHHRTSGETDDGMWNSAYAGVVLGKSFDRFQVSLLTRRLHDARVPIANAKRRDNYGNISLDYYFYDPENKKASFQPSLFITREVGNDFLTEVNKTNKTTVGFRVKFN